jgi:hypothetical protein
MPLSLPHAEPDSAAVFPLANGSTASLAESAGATIERCLGLGLNIVDARTGELLYAATDQPLMRERAVASLRRDSLRRRQPLVVESSSGLLLVAMPWPHAQETRLMAIGVFLHRPPTCRADLECMAAELALDVDQAARWADGQAPQSSRAMARLVRLFHDRLTAESRADELETEVEKLSDHLASTFEEITLIYRLTRNLSISRSREELARLAVEWLADIVPARSIAIQLVGRRPTDQLSRDDGAPSPWITACDRVLDNAGFTRLIEYLRLDPHSEPLVINNAEERHADWPFPGIHELVICPIGSNGHHSGWMAAFNHRQRDAFGSAAEFGSAEVDVLCSVSAILGIHGGNTELYRQQNELLSGIVRALTSAIDAKDPYTRGHSDRVARVAVRLAQELGCAPDVIETIYLSGLLHDVGKIGIDDNVLRKPGRLTKAEFEHIKTHARIGHNILADLKQLDQVRPVVLHHHESWDGTGYPDGLKSESIPWLARIVAVADAFDAMGSDRPYRRGMAAEELNEVIRAGAGRQWDPRVVEAFFRARADIEAIGPSAGACGEPESPESPRLTGRPVGC